MNTKLAAIKELNVTQVYGGRDRGRILQFTLPHKCYTHLGLGDVAELINVLEHWVDDRMEDKDVAGEVLQQELDILLKLADMHKYFAKDRVWADMEIKRFAKLADQYLAIQDAPECGEVVSTYNKSSGKTSVYMAKESTPIATHDTKNSDAWMRDIDRFAVLIEAPKLLNKFLKHPECFKGECPKVIDSNNYTIDHLLKEM